MEGARGGDGGGNGGASSADGGPAADAKADDLFAVGDHCSACGALDFLPHPCALCGATLCSAHRLPDAHGCKGAQAGQGGATSAPLPRGERCGVEGCGAEAKVQPCGGCGSMHCPKHRHASDHGCAGAAAETDADAAARRRAEDAHAAAKARADAARASAEAKRAAWRKKINPKKLKSAAMLAKTKMKLSATGDRGVSEASRFYLRVLLDTGPPAGDAPACPLPSKALFFSSSAAAGKVLDRCAEAFGTKVQPSKEGEGMLRMFRVAAPPTLVPTNVAVGSVGDLLNGDTVVLSRRGADELEDDDRLFS